MSHRIHFSYFAGEGDSPGRNFHASDYGNWIPALYLTDHLGTMAIQWQPNELPEAVRYLRELAAVATDLADQVQKQLEDATVEAVLQS